MNFAYTMRIRVGIVLVVFFSLLSSYQLLVKWVQSDLSFIGRDEITMNEKRFDGIKESLPTSGVVGYYTNGRPQTLEQLMFGNPGDLKGWLLTQYSLAPLIVSPTLGHSLIVSNTSSHPRRDQGSGKPLIRETPDGRKELDYGNGVKLIKRELQ